jgi:hypothetical protein
LCPHVRSIRWSCIVICRRPMTAPRHQRKPAEGAVHGRTRGVAAQGVALNCFTEHPLAAQECPLLKDNQRGRVRGGGGGGAAARVWSWARSCLADWFQLHCSMLSTTDRLQRLWCKDITYNQRGLALWGVGTSEHIAADMSHVSSKLWKNHLRFQPWIRPSRPWRIAWMQRLHLSATQRSEPPPAAGLALQQHGACSRKPWKRCKRHARRCHRGCCCGLRPSHPS